MLKLLRHWDRRDMSKVDVLSSLDQGWSRFLEMAKSIPEGKYDEYGSIGWWTVSQSLLHIANGSCETSRPLVMTHYSALCVVHLTV